MSDGLIPPLNAPPAGQLSPGVQPGTTPGIVLAQYVIVFGTAGGVFLYSGSPGAGNPPVAWMSTAAKDPYGNTLTPASDVVIGAGQDGSPQAVLKLSGTSGEIEFPLPGTWTNYPNMYGSVSGSGGELSVNGPTDTSVNDQAYIVMVSAAIGYEGGSAGSLYYADANGGHNTIALWGDSGLVINAGVISAVKPGTGGSPVNPAAQETWHDVSLDSGWTNADTLRYKLVAEKNAVWVQGAVTHASFSAAADINSSNPLPSEYWPANTHNIGGPGIPGRAGAEITAAGVIIAEPNGTSCTECDINGWYPLD